MNTIREYDVAATRTFAHFHAVRKPVVYMTALLFSLCALGVYVISGVTAYPSGDVMPYALLPFSILLHHDFFLGRYFDAASLTQSVPYFLHPTHGDYVGYEPGIGPAFTALPMYAVAVLFGMKGSIDNGEIMSKLSASVIMAISVGIVYIVLRKLNIRAWVAVLFTILYAFGSETFAVSSQALWRHGPSELWLAVFLLCVVHVISEPQRSRGAAMSVGLAMGLLFLCRAQNVVLVLPFVLLAGKKQYRKAILWAIPIFFICVFFYEWYKLQYFHAAPITSDLAESSRLSGNFLTGFLGITFSPNRGLFVFMPWTIFSVLWFAYANKKSAWRSIYLLTGITMIIYIFMYAKLSYWDAGTSFGPRYMTDMLPACTVLAAGFVETVLSNSDLSRWRTMILHGMLVVFTIWSVGVQFLGTEVPRGILWNDAVHPDAFQSPMWFVKNGELTFYWHTLQTRSHSPIKLTKPGVSFHSFQLQGVQQKNGGITLLSQQLYSGTMIATNTGEGTWLPYPAKDEGEVFLDYVVYHNGKKVQVPGVESTIPLHAVTPGQSIKLYFYIQTPAIPGHYTYVFTMAQVGYSQFNKGTSVTNTLQVPITVSAR